ncbi:MAG: S-layer homology domain-containing protein [Acidobacteria bacterium]|nr:S-layer homology domain-containing protein [Acidobacteriota bacterium]
MIRATAIVVAAVIVLGFAAVPVHATPPDAAGAFIDDDGSVHEPNINAIKAAGITKGCNPPANTLFCPTRSLTRAELASLFVRAFELPPAPSSGFQDIAGSVHKKNIDALAAAGITKGCNPPANTLFCPNLVTTRAEMASFLARVLGLPPAPDQPFIDVAGTIHRVNIAALAFAGITKGCNPPTNDLYCPGESVSREQIASFVTRALPDLSPVYNQLSLLTGVVCAKDGMSCTRSFTAAKGIQWEVTGGWYNVLPFLAGEEAMFDAPTTRLEVELNGVPVRLTELDRAQAGSLVRRLFTVVLDPIGRGSNTIVARWRWNGTVVRTLTIRASG